MKEVVFHYTREEEGLRNNSNWNYADNKGQNQRDFKRGVRTISRRGGRKGSVGRRAQGLVITAARTEEANWEKVLGTAGGPIMEVETKRKDLEKEGEKRAEEVGLL